MTEAAMTPNSRNPPWTWEEDVLALDLYVRLGLDSGGSLPGPANADVVNLSELLNARSKSSSRRANFRNPPGVARKLSNFRAVQHPGTGSAHTASMDERVWNELHDDQGRLKRIASRIRSQ